MEIIKEWVRSVFVLIVALTFIEILMPSTKIRPYIHFVFSLVIMAAFLAPAAGLLE